MFTLLNTKRSTVIFVIILFVAVVFVTQWFTGKKGGDRDLYLSGSFYLEDRIDTLTVLPAFESLIRQIRPRLIIADDFAVFSLNLLHQFSPDSAPEWGEEVRGQFTRKMDILKDELNIDVRYVQPWRLDIVQARRNLLQSLKSDSEFSYRASAYASAREAVDDIFPADTLFNYPLLLNSAMFDITRKIEQTVFNRLFNINSNNGEFETYNNRVFSPDEKNNQRIICKKGTGLL